MSDLAKLTADDFLPHVGIGFALNTPHGDSLPLRLAAVAPHCAAVPTRANAGFTLNFVGPSGFVLPQAIYPIGHPTLGTIEIFLVSSGPEQGGVGYHAVFG